MQEELERLRAENAHLRSLLRSRGGQQDNHAERATGSSSGTNDECGASPSANQSSPLGWECGAHDLTREQITRYSRQLILPAFGVAGAQFNTGHTHLVHAPEAVVIFAIMHS